MQKIKFKEFQIGYGNVEKVNVGKNNQLVFIEDLAQLKVKSTL